MQLASYNVAISLSPARRGVELQVVLWMVTSVKRVKIVIVAVYLRVLVVVIVVYLVAVRIAVVKTKLGEAEIVNRVILLECLELTTFTMIQLMEDYQEDKIRVLGPCQPTDYHFPITR